MSIIVETGAIVTGANSYVSIDDFVSYAEAREIALEAGSSVLLLQAMDYIEAQSYIGSKLTKEQPLQWPRTGACVDGYYVDTDEIPGELKAAQIETALAIDAGNSPLAVVQRTVKREKMEGLGEVEYADNAPSNPVATTINNALKKLLSSSGSGYGIVRV